MSTDYRMFIHRKSDNKLIGVANVNAIKNIFDSEFADQIHYSRFSSDNITAKFTHDELATLMTNITTKLDNVISTIVQKKLMIACAQNLDVKHELEEELSYLDEQLDDYKRLYWAAAFIDGIISTTTEDAWKNIDIDAKALEYEKAWYANGNCGEVEFSKEFDEEFTNHMRNDVAYTYNGEDLKTDDGSHHCVWVDDVYCVVKDF